MIKVTLEEDTNSLLDFRTEEARLATFADWTVSFIKPLALSAAGFYFLKRPDTCRSVDLVAEMTSSEINKEIVKLVTLCRCAFCQICLEIDPNDVQFFSTMEWHFERLVTLETSY